MSAHATPDSSVPAGSGPAPQSILRVGSVRLVGVLGQAVADVGAVTAVAILVGLIAAVSGPGNWLSWLFTMPVFFAAAYCFSTIARHYTTTGGLPALIAKATGSGYGLVVGVLILLFAFAYQPFQDMAFSLYLKDFLNMISVPGTGWIYVVGGIIATVGATFASYRDVRFAAALLVAIEVVASTTILILMVVVLTRHHGSVFDGTQLHLKGVSAHTVILGAVFACLTFVSFECSTTFGQEASEGKRTIPFSLFGVLAYGGALLVFCSYVMTLGFEGVKGTTLATDPNPLDTLTRIYGVHWLAYPLDLSIVVALWGTCLALINWCSRMLFTYGRERILPQAMGAADPRHKTPRNALLVILAINVVVYFVFDAIGRISLTQFGYVASSVTLFYLLGYVIAGLACAYTGARQGHAGLVAAGLLTSAGFAYVAYNTLSPAPAYPQNIYDYVVLGISAAVIVLGLVSWAVAPSWVKRFGSSVDADTALSDEGAVHHPGDPHRPMPAAPGEVIP